MAEYLIQDTTLTGIADKIRVLNGTEEAMTPAEMQTILDTHNTEINQALFTQDDLIMQIATALEGKKGASSGSEVIFGQVTRNSTTNITVFDSIGKENLILLLEDSHSVDYRNTYLTYVYFHNGSIVYSLTHPNGISYGSEDDGLLEYNIETGTIDITFSYNELFGETYLYFTW